MLGPFIQKLKYQNRSNGSRDIAILKLDSFTLNFYYCLQPPLPTPKERSRLSMHTQPPVTNFADNTDLCSFFRPLPLLLRLGKFVNLVEPT